MLCVSLCSSTIFTENNTKGHTLSEVHAGSRRSPLSPEDTSSSHVTSAQPPLAWVHFCPCSASRTEVKTILLYKWGFLMRMRGKNTGKDKMNVKQPHPRLLQCVQNPNQYYKKPSACMHFRHSFTETSQCIDLAFSLMCNLFKRWIPAVQ